MAAREPAPSTMLLLLMLAGVINFLDRSSLSIANLSIRADFGLSATQMGLVLSCFSLSYGLMQLPVGPMLDRFGAQPVLGVSLGVWSLVQALTSLVVGLRTLVFSRSLLGLGEAPFFPASVKLVRELFAPEQRGRATASVNVSTTIGQGLAPPLLTWLLIRFGWRSMFGAIGVLGLVLSAVWLIWLRPQRTHPSSERALPTPWASLFRHPTIWLLMVGFGGVNYTSWFYISWLPAYLQSERGVSLFRSGWLLAAPFLAGAAGMYTSGAVADVRIGRGASPQAVHRSHMVAGLWLSAVCTAAAAKAPTLTMALLCICAALFLVHFAGTSAWGYVQAVAPRHLVGTVGSIQNFGSFLFASLAPVLTGWSVDRYHAFSTGFFLCSGFGLLGGLAYTGLRSRVPLAL